MLDSAEVSAMLDILILNSMFAGLYLGFILPKFFKLIDYSLKFLSKKLDKDKSKKLGKNKKKKVKNSNNSEVMK